MKWFFRRVGYNIALRWLDLSRVDHVGIGILAVMVVALCITVAVVPSEAKRAEAEAQSWRFPGRELPDQMQEVTGFYIDRFMDKDIEAKTVTYGVKPVRIDLVFMSCYEKQDGREVYVEAWVHDDGTGGAGADMERPICWAPRRLAAGLKDPDLPNLYLSSRARK